MALDLYPKELRRRRIADDHEDEGGREGGEGHFVELDVLGWI